MPKKITSGSIGETMTAVESMVKVTDDQRRAAKKNVLAHPNGGIDILEMLDLDMVDG